MAINQDDHQLLLGECKFTQEPINARIVRALIEDKLPKVDVDRTKAWQTRYVFFSRSGFTPDAKATAKSERCQWVDLSRLASELTE